jgi:hypothetical protein
MASLSCAVTALKPRPMERLFLAAGLATVTGSVPSALRLDPAELSSLLIDELLHTALAQKMLPMLVRAAAQVGLTELPSIFRDINEIYRRKMQALYQDVAVILPGLQAVDVDVLLLKGSDLALSSYPGDLPRMMADIDLIVRPPDLAAATRVFESEGYLQGRVNMEQLTVVELSAAEKHAIESNHYELAPFIRLRSLGRPEQHHRKVIQERLHDAFFVVVGDRWYFGEGFDLHFNVSDDIALEDVWDQVRIVTLPDGTSVKAQSATNLVWFTLARAYHETMFESAPPIRHFIDVLAVVNAHHQAVDWDRLAYVARKYQLFPSLFYFLSHARELLGRVVPDWILEVSNPGATGVDRYHDWGDPIPKLLRGVVRTQLV